MGGSASCPRILDDSDLPAGGHPIPAKGAIRGECRLLIECEPRKRLQPGKCLSVRNEHLRRRGRQQVKILKIHSVEGKCARSRILIDPFSVRWNAGKRCVLSIFMNFKTSWRAFSGEVISGSGVGVADGIGERVGVAVAVEAGISTVVRACQAMRKTSDTMVVLEKRRDFILFLRSPAFL